MSVSVTVTSGEGLAVTTQAGPHRLAADEPAGSGGTGTGPDPYSLLLAALGTCTAMTLLMYARRKNWPLTRVTVRLRQEKVHAQDCAECEDRTGRVDRTPRAVTLTGPLEAAQRARLMEIARRCPVHQTLEGRPVIVDREGA